MNESKLWKFILERLNKSQPVIFMCVLESSGSSPGRQGFKMAVAADDMIGSIGGGIMEHKFVEMAKEKLNASLPDSIIKKQFHNKIVPKHQSGMICSGEQTIFLYQVQPGDIPAIEKIIICLEQNQNGQLKITMSGIGFSEKIIPKKNYLLNIKSENDWAYFEKLGYKNHLFIVGGGHCALAFSKMMSTMDFYIHLFEDRKNLNTFSQNIFAHEKKIVKDYPELADLISSGEHCYVVIMTFGYRTDDVALRALIEKDFGYIGVLGSKSKMEQLFAEWRRDGIDEERLKRIYSPIGISIHSRTPEEIAVSIAAEIIKVKNMLSVNTNT